MICAQSVHTVQRISTCTLPECRREGHLSTKHAHSTGDFNTHVARMQARRSFEHKTRTQHRGFQHARCQNAGVRMIVAQSVHTVQKISTCMLPKCRCPDDSRTTCANSTKDLHMQVARMQAWRSFGHKTCTQYRGFQDARCQNAGLNVPSVPPCSNLVPLGIFWVFHGCSTGSSHKDVFKQVHTVPGISTRTLPECRSKCTFCASVLKSGASRNLLGVSWVFHKVVSQRCFRTGLWAPKTFKHKMF
jgi:hypothetical protein